jgi:hypothetical protein
MALEAILTDGIAHAGVGMALSFLDFLTYKLTNPVAKRLEHKKACLQSIEVLLDTEQPQPQSQDSDTSEAPGDSGEKVSPEAQPSTSSAEIPPKVVLQKDSTQYAEHVTVVRDYLRTSGLVKLQLPLFDRLKDGLKNLIVHEKINTLTNVQKLGVAFGFEVLYDILFDFRSGMAGIAASLYQIPAFFLGLWVGNGVKKVINFFLTPGDEKKLDTTIQQLIKDTSIVDIVVKYAPSEQVKSDLAARGIQVYMSQLTQAGKSAYKRLQQFAGTAKQLAGTAKSAADDVIHFTQKQEEKEQQEREARQKRFDELTKGR